MRLVHLLRLHSKLPPGVKATCPSCRLAMDHNVPFSRGMASQRVASGVIG
jgi:hypothetical protein